MLCFLEPPGTAIVIIVANAVVNIMFPIDQNTKFD